MIFQKSSYKNVVDENISEPALNASGAMLDDVETVVGPSVNVEGDFASEGNIIVKGSVAGSVHTSRHLSVELGAKIMANVKADSAKISGEVRGNMKVKNSLELTSTAKIAGDIEAKILVIEAGALLCGKVIMPGLDNIESRGNSKQKNLNRKNEPVIEEIA